MHARRLALLVVVVMITPLMASANGTHVGSAQGMNLNPSGLHASTDGTEASTSLAQPFEMSSRDASGIAKRSGSGDSLQAVPPSPDTVFPPDDRQYVYPASPQIAYLDVYDQLGALAGACTATFIGPQVLLTTAHCLYLPAYGGWAGDVKVIPGRDGVFSAPFGFDYGSRFTVPNGWITTFDPQYDWGLIYLSSPLLGTLTGWATIGALTTSTLSMPDFKALTIGYPEDKPFGTQWAAGVLAFQHVSDEFLFSQLDAYPGQSGSGVFRVADGMLVGVLESETQITNAAVRITQSIIASALLWCADTGCSFPYYVEPDVTPPPSNPPPTSASAFDTVWATTDQAITNGQASYSWFWGPQPNDHRYEPYAQSPGGQREVQYYDKSRMEINNPGGDQSSIYYVTNGLLTEELVTGKLQTGDSAFNQLAPANVPVAGDPANNPGTPTYALFGPLATTDGATNRANDLTGQAVTAYLYGNGSVATTDASGVALASFQTATGHNIPNVFWDWMNDPANGFRPDQGVDWLYVLGYPITEPYWIDSTVGGVTRRVLVQLYERRVLTYTPSNPAQYQVEFGNIGQHYHTWRYGN